MAWTDLVCFGDSPIREVEFPDRSLFRLVPEARLVDVKRLFEKDFIDPVNDCDRDIPCIFPCYQGICAGEEFARDWLLRHSVRVEFLLGTPLKAAREAAHEHTMLFA